MGNKCVPLEGEPSFTLLGRDPVAALVIGFWVELRKAMGLDTNGTDEELIELCAGMAKYAKKMGKAIELVRSLEVSPGLHTELGMIR